MVTYSEPATPVKDAVIPNDSVFAELDAPPESDLHAAVDASRFWNN